MPVGGPSGAQAQNETPICYWSFKRSISSTVHHCVAKLTKATPACCQSRECWAYADQSSHPMTRAKASSCVHHVIGGLPTRLPAGNHSKARLTQVLHSGMNVRMRASSRLDAVKHGCGQEVAMVGVGTACNPA